MAMHPRRRRVGFSPVEVHEQAVGVLVTGVNCLVQPGGHEHLVTIEYGFKRVDDEPYLAMRIVKGGGELLRQ